MKNPYKEMIDFWASFKPAATLVGLLCFVVGWLACGHVNGPGVVRGAGGVAMAIFCLAWAVVAWLSRAPGIVRETIFRSEAAAAAQRGEMLKISLLFGMLAICGVLSAFRS